MHLILKYYLKLNVILLYQNMNQIIKPESVDFNKLIKSNTTLTNDCQSKMIEILNKEFTEE